MKLTSVSLDRPTYYKNYYQRNKLYLRHRQRLRYYRNSPKFYELLHEYNKIILDKNKFIDHNFENLQKTKYNYMDTDKLFILMF